MKKNSKIIDKMQDVVSLLSEIENSLTVVVSQCENREKLSEDEYNEARSLALRLDVVLRGLGKKIENVEKYGYLSDFIISMGRITLPEFEIAEFHVNVIQMELVKIRTDLERAEVLKTLLEEGRDVHELFNGDGSGKNA